MSDKVENGFTVITPKMLTDLYVQRLVLRYLPRLTDEQLKRVSEAAPTFMRVNNGVDFTSPRAKELLQNAVKNIPMYVQGDAGVGKTKIPEKAARIFCRIAGLNFVRDPGEGFVPGKNDFVFSVIDMSGKNNIADIAGIMVREKIAGEEAASLVGPIKLAAEAISRYACCQVDIGSSHSDGQLQHFDIVFRVRNPADIDVAKDAASSLIETAIYASKKEGVTANLVSREQDVMPGTVSMRTRFEKDQVVVSFSEPKMRATYASSLLANKQLALPAMAKFGALILDDIGNIPQHLRNVFLQLALEGVVNGVADLRHIEIGMTANPPKNKLGMKNSNVQSADRSFPEITRTLTYHLTSKPEDWLDYIAGEERYQREGDAHFHSFIDLHKNVPGIFSMSDDPGAKYTPGAPVPCGRSLERAIQSVLPYYHLAELTDVSPLFYSEEIEREVSAAVGKFVATSYVSHVRAMESDAIPMAKTCIDKGEIDEAKFNALSNPTKGSGKDFSFRFGYALADYAAKEIRELDFANDKGQEKIIAVIKNMLYGMAYLDPSVMNASLTRLKSKIELGNGGEEDLKSSTGRKISEAAFVVLAKGMSEAKKYFEEPEQAIEDFTSSLTGAVRGLVNKPTTRMKP